MSIQAEINRINNNISDAYDAVDGKGGTIPSSQDSAHLASAIGSIPVDTNVEWDDILNKPETFTPSSHNHDDRYYTKTEANTLLNGKLDANAMTTATKTKSSITVSANNSTVVSSFSADKTGYTPVGILGILLDGTGSANICISSYSISGNSADGYNVRLVLRNVGSTNRTVNCTTIILYRAN